MNFAHPWFLLGLAIAVPVVIAFLMRRRRAVLRVPSVFLWKGASLKRIRNRRVRSITRLLALIACVLAVLAMALASSVPRDDEPSETVAVVVDVSATMGCGKGRGTPLAQARRYLAKMLLARASADQYVIIAAGAQPRRLAGPTSDGELLDRAVASLLPERGGADLGGAVDLAVRLIESRPDPRLVILHDGGDTSGDPPRALDRAELTSVLERRFAPSGSDEEDTSHNVGIVTFSARRPSDAETGEEREVLIAVATASPQARQIALTIEAFDTPLTEQRVEIPANGEAELRLRVRTPAEELVARIEATDGLPDQLAVDNEARLIQGLLVPPRVVLVAAEDASEAETFFITQALEAAGVQEIVSSTPDRAHTAAQADDVVVVLDEPPSQRPAAPVLYLGTRSAGGELPVTGQRELRAASAAGDGGSPTRLHSVAEHHPLMHGVDLSGIAIHEALAADAPDGGRALVELDGGSVVLVGGDGAQGWVYVGLDPTRSDLVLRVAFPVLVANALALLGGATQVSVAQTLPRSEVTLRQGDPLAEAEAAELAVVVPRSVSFWLALLAALLLGAELLTWRKGWTR